MSLCTLPAPVSQSVLGWSPRINVVLFLTETHLVLCRKSGQQIWSTRLPTATPRRSATAVAWSSDGHYFGVIFDDGSYSLYLVSTGRPVSTVSASQDAVTSIAWPVSLAASQGLEHPTEAYHRPTKLTDIADDSEYLAQLGMATPEHSSIAIAGTAQGRVVISLYGALSIGDIRLGLESETPTPVTHVCAEENSGEYAAVKASKLYLYRRNAAGVRASEGATLGSAGVGAAARSREGAREFHEILNTMGFDTPEDIASELARTTARLSAKAIDLSASLNKAADGVLESVRSLRRVNMMFMESLEEGNPETTQETILTAALAGDVSPYAVQWMQSQHEQGFKRWYKAASQRWDTLRRLVVDDILVTLESLMSLLPRLQTKSLDMLRLYRKANETLRDVVKLSKNFELQATFIEYMFKQEIDRPISVTRLAKVKVGEVVTSLLEGLLCTLDESVGVEFVETTQQIRKDLDQAAQATRHALRAKLSLSFVADLGSGVSDLRRLDNGKYAAILKSRHLVLVGTDGSIEERSEITGEKPVFTGVGADLVSLLPDEHALFLSKSQERLQLDIKPLAVTCRVDGQKVNVCVLSEDQQHYQFLEV